MNTVDIHTPAGIVAAEYRESWRPQKRRNGATACRFMILYHGRWRRLWSAKSEGIPHFIYDHTNRPLSVSRVAP